MQEKSSIFYCVLNLFSSIIFLYLRDQEVQFLDEGVDNPTGPMSIEVQNFYW